MVRKLKGKAVTTYKGMTIYDDGVFYIYTQPQGKGRMDFSNMKEVIDYIDSTDEFTHTEQSDMADSATTYSDSIKHQFRVDYLNSVGYYAFTYVNAYTPYEAARIAEKILGNEIRCLDEIVQLPD